MGAVGAGPPRARAREATTLGRRWPVLARSGVDRGGAIPGAWAVLVATAPPAGRRAGLRLRRPVALARPRAGTVSVLAERLAVRPNSRGSWLKYAQTLDKIGETARAEAVRQQAAAVQ